MIVPGWAGERPRGARHDGHGKGLIVLVAVLMKLVMILTGCWVYMWRSPLLFPCVYFLWCVFESFPPPRLSYALGCSPSDPTSFRVMLNRGTARRVH